MNIREFLIETGNFPNLKGFNCLIKAVEIVKKNPGIKLTKELYPQIAKETNSTASKVERSIRHVVGRINIEHFERIGIHKYPTNGELIFYFAEGGKR